MGPLLSLFLFESKLLQGGMVIELPFAAPDPDMTRCCLMTLYLSLAIALFQERLITVLEIIDPRPATGFW